MLIVITGSRNSTFAVLCNSRGEQVFKTSVSADAKQPIALIASKLQFVLTRLKVKSVSVRFSGQVRSLQTGFNTKWNTRSMPKIKIEKLLVTPSLAYNGCRLGVVRRV